MFSETFSSYPLSMLYSEIPDDDDEDCNQPIIFGQDQAATAISYVPDCQIRIRLDTQ